MIGEMISGVAGQIVSGARNVGGGADVAQQNPTPAGGVQGRGGLVAAPSAQQQQQNIHVPVVREERSLPRRIVEGSYRNLFGARHS